MAAKGPRPRRGRKPPADAGEVPETEPVTEPITEPDATWTAGDDFAAVEDVHAEAVQTQPEDMDTVPEAVEAESGFEPEAVSSSTTTEEGAGWPVPQLVVAGLAVVLALAVLAGVMIYATADDPGLDQQARRLDAVAAQAESQESRMMAAEEAIGSLQSEVRRIANALIQLEGSVGDLQSAAEANRQNLDRVAEGIEALRSDVSVPADGAAAGEAVGELQGTIATLEERLTGLEQAVSVDELAGLVARLEKEVAALRRQAAGRMEDAEAAGALGRSYAALSEQLAAGAPFAAELEAVTAQLPDAPGIEALRPLAAEGVPTAADLQARLAAIASELPRGERGDAPAGDGFWQAMGERLEGMVTVRRTDEADLPAVLARAGEALQRGDVETAIADVEQLDVASDEVETWLAEARARRDAEAALEALSDAVVRQLAGRQ